MRNQMTQPIRRLLILAVTVVAMGLVVSWLLDAAVRAQPRPSRRVRHSPERRYRGLAKTARIPRPPDIEDYYGEYGPYPCEDIDGTEAWGFFPSDQTISLENPYEWPGIAIWLCGQEHDEDTQYILTGPDDDVIPLIAFLPDDAEDDALPLAYVHTMTVESQPGFYTVAIQSQSRRFTRTFLLEEEYPNPYVQLNEGEAIELGYFKFTPEEPIQVCLYRDAADGSESRLIDEWQVPADPQGGYSQVRAIDDLEDGHYILVATTDYAISCLETINPDYFYWRPNITAYSEFELEPGEGEDVSRADVEGQEPGLLPTTGQAASPYFDLQWVPGCDPTQSLALQSPGQGGCGSEVERRDIDWLTEELRKLGILGGDEWLVVVPLRPLGGQALAIQSESNDESGWVQVGGSVWRTTYYMPGRRVGMRCWLGGDYTWLCEK